MQQRCHFFNSDLIKRNRKDLAEEEWEPSCRCPRKRAGA